MGVITLAVMLIAGIVALMDSIPLSVSTIYSYSKYSLGASPRGDDSTMSGLKKRIESSSPVPIERSIVCRASTAVVHSIVGEWPFVVFGFEQDDMRYYVSHVGGGKLVGRFPEAFKPEAVVSRPVATNLGLKIGDTVLDPEKADAYSPFQVRVVGIVETDKWMIFAPIEYLREFHFPPFDVYLFMAKNAADQSRLDLWAMDEFKGERIRLYSYEDLKKQTDESFKTLYTILNVVVGSLVIVITVMMGMLMNIYQSQRIQEFGLLQALGYGKRVILFRLLKETLLVLMGSWVLGVLVAFVLLAFVKVQLFDPRAYALDPFGLRAYVYSVPVPLMIFAVSALDVVARLKKFDPVGVVERRLV